MMPLGPSLRCEIKESWLPLYDKIRDGHSDVAHFAYYLEYITFHMPEGKLDAALHWLIRNKLIGEKFKQFVQGECARSGLELVRHLTMRVERENKLRPLYAKDMA